MSYPPPNPPQRRSRPPTLNQKSSLLSEAENEKAFKLLGRKCSTMSTGIVQVFLASQNRWNKKGTGACCFVKDNPKRSYFIRVYNLSTEQMIFEQELYNQFKYATPRPYFHTFDTDTCRAGLNFADDGEANHFKNTVEEKIKQKQEKKHARTQQKPPPPSSPRPSVSMGHNHAPSLPGPNSQSSPHVVTTNIQRSAVPEVSKKDKKKNKGAKGKKGKLKKTDIGGPQDFKHVNHVGFDPEKGFDMNEVAPSYKDLFSQAGISDSQLQDKDTAQFIYDFIEKRGGVDAVARSQTSGPPPPPPSRGTRGSAPPPPPPSRPSGPPRPTASKGCAPPPPPNRGVRDTPPPPPPPGRGQRGPPPRPQLSMPPPAPGVPSPPPPPPPAPSAPPPPPMPSGGGRGGLLDQIQGGTSLRSAADRPAPEPQSGGRGGLLEQIRQGKQLRTVTADEMRDKPPMEDEDESGLAGALARALQMREKAIHDSDSDDDDDGEFNDDDDWD